MLCSFVRLLLYMIFVQFRGNCMSSSPIQTKFSILLGRHTIPPFLHLHLATDESISGICLSSARNKHPTTKKTDHLSCCLFMEVNSLFGHHSKMHSVLITFLQAILLVLQISAGHQVNQKIGLQPAFLKTMSSWCGNLPCVFGRGMK